MPMEQQLEAWKKEFEERGPAGVRKDLAQEANRIAKDHNLWLMLAVGISLLALVVALLT